MDDKKWIAVISIAVALSGRTAGDVGPYKIASERGETEFTKRGLSPFGKFVRCG